jgi:hypothetical protein
MKKLVFTLLLAIGSLSAQAGGHGSFGRGGWGYRGWGYHGWGYFPAASFYYGAYPGYGYGWPGYYSYPAYSYDYSPAYGSGYAYAQPNYAVDGTLLGALTGGLIGNSIHHQGWEGAGIGAAAGLLLGSVAEHDARVNERAYYAAPPVSYMRPATIPNAPTVNDAPTAAAASQLRSDPATTSAFRSAGSMSSANSLFGR